VVTTSEDLPSLPLLVARVRPKLVLLDSASLRDGGKRLVRGVREAWPDSIVLLHVSMSATELAELARGVGADGFICKSWDPETLLGLARAYLEGDRPGAKATTRRPRMGSERPSGKIYRPSLIAGSGSSSSRESA
jgi:DNA-binding NarL/FixJ family response regulator